MLPACLPCFLTRRPPPCPAQERSTKALAALLSAKPEGEARLLAALTNKLGDPSRKVASNAGYLLGQLLEAHPAMKPVVVREVRVFVWGRGEGGGRWGSCSAVHPAMNPPPPPPPHTHSHTHSQIERFVFRPGLSERAHYYAAITLNQFALSARPEEGGAALAKRMVEIYFK